MTKNQEIENFYHSSGIHECFISTSSLLNDLIKILVGLGIFSHVIFKDLESVIGKLVFLDEQTSICWFKYELRGFYDSKN